MATVTTVTTPTPDTDEQTHRSFTGGKFVDLLLAALANLAVVASWAVTALAVMGSLAIGRRILMNSEWALDFGRLPQPWVIPIGVVAIVVSHRFFSWAMRRYRRGKPAYGPSVLAWTGAFLGVALGAYLWVPPVVVGEQVGPKAGQSTPWGYAAWVAYYARLGLPALLGVTTGLLWLFSRQSPLRAFLASRQRARIARQRRKAERAANA